MFEEQLPEPKEASTMAKTVTIQISKDEASGKSRGAKLSPVPVAEEEVELAPAPATEDHGWRPVSGGKTTFSLSIPVQPQVIDVFTSPKGNTADRRRVFFLGESMQWNTVQRVTPLVKNVPYNVTLHLQKVGLGSFANDEARVESVFPFETKLSSNFKYRFAGTRNSWSWDKVPAFNGTITGTPSQIVDGLARGEFGLIAHPGIWRVAEGEQYELVAPPLQQMDRGTSCSSDTDSISCMPGLRDTPARGQPAN